MTLRLILGPANASKAGRLLDAHQAASRAGREAWFVVPTASDVERVERELAGLDGPPNATPRQPTPFGEVLTGSALERRLAARLGVRGRVLSKERRRAVVLAAIAATPLDVLGPGARAGWLADALIALREELLATGTVLADAAGGLRRWGAIAHDPRGSELAALLLADDARLRELAGATHQLDRARATELLVAGLRSGDADGDTLHLVLSGFDDLDPLQRTIAAALAHSSIEVELSLPWEQGRAALAAAQQLIEDLEGAGAQSIVLSGTPASDAQPTALERVERRLFEAPAVHEVLAPAASPADGLSFTDGFADGDQEAPAAPAAPAERTAQVDGTVVELCGGGPDEELALIAEYLAEQQAAGERLERMAVVVPQPATRGPEIAAALQRAGLAAHVTEPRKANAFPSVSALLALLRAASPDGAAKDLVAWLAGPGGPGEAGAADRLDAAVRRSGATSISDALKLWRRQGGGHLDELAALRSAHRPGAVERAAARALRLRLQQVLDPTAELAPTQQRDLRAAVQLLRTLDDLAAFAEQAEEHGIALRLGLPDLSGVLEAVVVPAEREPAASIAVLGPLAVRTRHLDTVVIAQAQRGSYPAPESMRRVLTPADRGVLHAHHEWPMPLRAPHSDAERYLAYEVAARPTRRLAIAWHAGDGDGKPAEPSPLLAELRRAADGATEQRALEIGAAARHALSAERIARLAAAREAPRHRECTHLQSDVLAGRDHSDGHGVRGLQAAARCPAQWLVDQHLRPQPLRPDEDPLTAGRMRHDLLADAVRALVNDGQQLGPHALPQLRQHFDDAVARLAAKTEREGETLRERITRERVVAEVAATLPSLCGDATLEHQPQEFEIGFGGRGRGEEEDGDARPPVVIEQDGHRLLLSGRIDRVDMSAGGEVVVVDYKGANVAPYKGNSWEQARELQAGLYALVAQQLAGEGARAVASFYQPVPGSAANGARGATSKPLAGRAVSKNDLVGGDRWDALLEALVALAASAQRDIDDGVVRPDPANCSSAGCRYPWLCREVGR